MTHDRDGAVLIGTLAFGVLAADLAYVADRWTGIGSKFGRAFTFGFVSMILVGLLARLFGAGRSVGPDRMGARRRTRVTNVIFVVLVLSLIETSRHVFSSQSGFLFGMFAALGALFTTVSCYWVLRPAHADGDIP